MPKPRDIKAAFLTVLAISLIAGAACASDTAQADRPPVPTPDMTAASATMEAISQSPEQLSEVRSIGATILAEMLTRGPTRAEVGPSTAGAKIEIAGREFTLPDDVFIVDRITYSWGEVSSALPRWVLGKGESTIGVAQNTGEFSRESLINAPGDHFDELRRKVSAAVAR